MKRRRCKQCGKLFMPVGKEAICSVACRQARMKERAERRKAAYKKSEWEFYSRAVRRYPNVLWTQTADMIASQIKGV